MSGGLEIILAVEESPEGVYTARALGCAIYTQADTIVTSGFPPRVFLQ